MSQSPIIRPGVPADSYAVFLVFEEAVAHLVRRWLPDEPMSIDDPDQLAGMWQERRSLYEHLAETADQFWVAEEGGRVVGFARSIVRDGHWELTEFFVLPGYQAMGLGRQLLARTAPPPGMHSRTIVATPDIRAQALYLKSGVYPRVPLYYFGGQPRPATVESDLAFEPLRESPEALAALGAIDREILELRRDADHKWLLSNGQGYLYRRNGRPAGYGYAGLRNGPFALLDGADFPAVLAHAENLAAEAGRNHFGVEVPMINSQAVQHLLARGFQMQAFIALLMSDRPFGRFDNYIVTSPPFFL